MQSLQLTSPVRIGLSSMGVRLWPLCRIYFLGVRRMAFFPVNSAKDVSTLHVFLLNVGLSPPSFAEALNLRRFGISGNPSLERQVIRCCRASDWQQRTKHCCKRLCAFFWMASIVHFCFSWFRRSLTSILGNGFCGRYWLKQRVAVIDEVRTEATFDTTAAHHRS